MQIDDTEDALEVVLDLHPVLQRAEIVTDVQIARRLDAGKYTRFHGVVSNDEVSRGANSYRTVMESMQTNTAGRTVTIEKLVYGGDGLARDNGQVIMTPLVL